MDHCTTGSVPVYHGSSLAETLVIRRLYVGMAVLLYRFSHYWSTVVGPRRCPAGVRTDHGLTVVLLRAQCLGGARDVVQQVSIIDCFPVTYGRYVLDLRLLDWCTPSVLHGACFGSHVPTYHGSGLSVVVGSGGRR